MPLYIHEALDGVHPLQKARDKGMQGNSPDMAGESPNTPLRSLSKMGGLGPTNSTSFRGYEKMVTTRGFHSRQWEPLGHLIVLFMGEKAWWLGHGSLSWRDESIIPVQRKS